MKKIALIIIAWILPLLSFSQNEALWLRYPAISPDGSTIAFTYMSDIYTVSVKGGQALRLTSGEDIEYKPVWSPDGKSIAYASDRHGNFDIFIIKAEGGTPVRLTYHSTGEIPSAFSPGGKYVLFSASIQDVASSAAFPRSYLNELYRVPATGGRVKQVLSTPAENARYNRAGTKILYQDSKGPENEWRKHHKSSVTRDIWIYDTETGKHKNLTNRKGEDLYPVFSSDETAVYYVGDSKSEDLNVYKIDLMLPEVPVQVTDFEHHPVRFLSIANNDLLCYSFNGEIYVSKEGKVPVKVPVTIRTDAAYNAAEYYKKSSGASEVSVSPDGKEVAFILRGNVFVTSSETGASKQITDTPGQERSVSFSPDGKKLLYAAEREGSWNIYECKPKDENAPNFVLSLLFEETALVNTKAEEFQPAYSPDGKKVAYLHERTELKVINLKSKETRTVLKGYLNYSYTDGDQHYAWSPDSKYLLVQYSPHSWVLNDAGLIKADGSDADKPLNLTQSGYSDTRPTWAMNGDALIWFSDRNGYRSHGSWGAHYDVYAMFLNEEAFNKFNLSKEEYLLYKEAKKKEKKDSTEIDKKTKSVKIDTTALEDRVKRLTINSSSLSDAVLTPDGEKLFYLAKFEKGYDLWVHEIRENKTKIAVKLSGSPGSLHLDKEGKTLYLFSGGRIYKINTSSYKKEAVSYTAEYELDRFAEREYLFEHVWRTIHKKFYVKDMHGVDWDFYKKEYEKFLPHINNNFDFAEMLSEMLGELNASHTGAGVRKLAKKGDKTAWLGALYDWSYSGKGLKIEEVVHGSPLSYTETEIKKGTIILKINDNEILPEEDYYRYLNRQAGKRVQLTIKLPGSAEKKEIIIKPVSLAQKNKLMYKRWVEDRREQTEKLSNGKLGYVHVKGMNSAAFRQVYSDLLGKHYGKEAVVIDTRYNHGGWLHDDLATLFSGKKYVTFVPREQKFGYDPFSKWVKPSALLVSEGNYSDAHAFPYVYQTLKIGKIIGMPVPGTMTAVWWESLQDKSLYFGMPQVGTLDVNGNYLENQELQPDVKVQNDYEEIIKNRDQQLEKAVEVLLEELDNQK